MKLQRNNAFSIDAYTNYLDYNNALNALKNNGVEYFETLQSVSPFYYFIFLENKDKPLLMNYDEMNSSQWKTLLTKVQPLTPNDEYLLYRRNDKVTSIFKDIVNNDYMNEALKEKTVIVFNEQNKQLVQNMSRTIDSKFYALGKYYSKYKLWCCFSSEVKNFVKPGNILLEGKFSKVGQLEQKLNFEVLVNKEKLIKYSKTPYYEKGQLVQTSPVSPVWKGL